MLLYMPLIVAFLTTPSSPKLYGIVWKGVDEQARILKEAVVI
jgi:hypothetical protein